MAKFRSAKFRYQDIIHILKLTALSRYYYENLVHTQAKFRAAQTGKVHNCY